MKLDQVLTLVPGIGPSTYLKLKASGLTTVLDLLQQYPTRHEDYQLRSQIAFLQPGEIVTIRAVVKKATNEFTRKKGLSLQKLSVADLSGNIDLVWFNQPFILRQFKSANEYYFSGKVSSFGNKNVLNVAEYEPVVDIPLHTARLVPYYSSTLGLSSRVLRQRIFWLLTQIKNKNYPDFDILLNLHFPKNKISLLKAKQNLSFAQLLTIKLTQIQQEKLQLQNKTVTISTSDNSYKQVFIQSLPFKLTESQEQVLAEIDKDFASPSCKPRLLMGEVGSGKTTIMAYATYLMAKNRYQTLVMTPTEALAQQHLSSFKELLMNHNLNIVLLTSRSKPVNLSQADVIIGTQALMFAKINWDRLGLLIVDEQHKFGVLQREFFKAQAKPQPRLLLVSATPIPRSLALTLYHHTNLSYLVDKPYPNQVRTFLVPDGKRESSYQWLRKLIKNTKHQAYLACPAIENKQGTPNELKTVKQEALMLSQKLPDLRIKAIYSRHTQKEKIINEFRQQKIDILITTSLIEVGIDIGTANIIIIENADRFGLNQLHQLRGRIGRRGQKGYCLLFSSSKDLKTINRLKVLENSNDGARIALEDLISRGSGDFLGISQHGLNFIQTQDLFNSQLMAKVNSIAEKMVAKGEDREYTSLLVKKLV